MSTAIKSVEDKLKILTEWKKLYTEAMINALHPSGDVLQIGFGTDFNADQIQKHHPKSHTIIEANPQVYEAAQKWASKHQKINLIKGNWNQALPKLKTFDAIFFNEYPLEYEIAIMNFLFPEDTFRTSKEVRKLIHSVEEQLSQMSLQFTDRDIEEFYQEIGQYHLNEMPEFFQKLKENGNITKAQYDHAAKKHHFSQLQKQKSQEPGTPEEQAASNMLSCLGECLKRHMNNNATFLSFLDSQTSKYDNSQYYDNIISNPHIDYKESKVQIKTSDHPREGLIALIRKKS
jgi:hypothetical protein